MNSSETTGDYIESINPIQLIRKTIRKSKKMKTSKRCSDSSINTFTDTLTKSMPGKVICPLNDFLPESIEFSRKPIIIPSLQTLLSNSS